MSHTPDRGFTLVEILLAGGILAVVLVSIAPLFVVALRTNASAGDLTNCVALAQERMEKIRNVPWADLTYGGSVDSPTDGFSQYVDVDANAKDDFVLAWSISDVGTLSSALTASKIYVREVGVACSTLRNAKGRSGQARKVLLNTYVTRGVI